MPGRITTSCPTILGWFFSPKSPDHTRAADRASPLPRRAKSERSVPRVEQPDQQIHHEGTESTKSSRRSAAEVRSRLGATPLHTSLRVLRVFVVDCLDVTLLAEETAKQFVTCESGTPVNRSVLDNSISAGHLRLPAVRAHKPRIEPAGPVQHSCTRSGRQDRSLRMTEAGRG